MSKGRLAADNEIQILEDRYRIDDVANIRREVAHDRKAVRIVDLLSELPNLQGIELYAWDAIEVEKLLDRNASMTVDVIERRSSPSDADMQLAIRKLPVLWQLQARVVYVRRFADFPVGEAERGREADERRPAVRLGEGGGLGDDVDVRNSNKGVHK